MRETVDIERLPADERSYRSLRHKCCPDAERMLARVAPRPAAIMYVDKDFILRYMSEPAYIIFKPLEIFLAEKVDNMIGRPVEQIHKNFRLVRRIIADPMNFPFSVRILVGTDILDLCAVHVKNSGNENNGLMLTWSVVKKRAVRPDAAPGRRLD